MLPIKLVLDTNIIVSAHLKPTGLERTVLEFALTSPAEMFVSPPILAEYAGVLRRVKFKIDPGDVKKLLLIISRQTRFIEPKLKINAAADPDDNIFLECAEAARADYLITGNKKHFPVFWGNTKIINSRELLAVMAGHLGLGNK